MGKTNKERALNLLAVIDIRNNYALTQHGRTDDPAMSDADVVERLLDKAERRGRRKAAAVFAENTALKARIACLKYGQPFDDTEHYRSKGESYDVELTRDGATVTARVWDMPESARGKDELVTDGEYKIKSHCGVQIMPTCLFLWGTMSGSDKSLETYTFPTVVAARDYFSHITALIDKLNEEYKPASRVDAEEVRELLDELMHCQHIFDHTKSSSRTRQLFARITDARTALLAALGINDK